MAIFGNCKSQKETAMAALPVADTKLIALQSFACRGFCPVYTLTFYNSGLLEYNGERFVEKTGAATVTLTLAEVATLRSEVNRTNLWQYPDEIKAQVMDAPYATLTVWNGDKTKSVRGTIDRPKPLMELEKTLKNLAEAHGLQVIKGVNPNQPAEQKGEVILKLRPKEDAAKWINQFSEIKLRLVRHIQEDTWLVGYDPGQIEEKQLLELFKGTEGALEVQANRPVKDRN